MAVTIQQIADQAGVSRGTVDRALNNRGRINPEVSKRIHEIAEELGYVPANRRKRSSSSPAVIKIGIVTLLSKSAFMIQVRKGIRDAEKILAYRGVKLLVRECASVDETEQLAAIKELVEQDIAGLALMPVESDAIREQINQLTEERQIPVVTFNSDIIGTKRCCFVGLDNKKSGMTAAGLMGMLTGGTGSILVITGFFSNSVNSLRVDGFIEEIKKAYPELMLTGVQCCFDDTAEAERLVLAALDTHPDLAGIFIASSGQAGVWNAFRKKNLQKRPNVIIYDLTDANEQALLDGNADFLIDQEVYLQGYQPPLILTDLIQRGIPPRGEYNYTNIRIMTKYNIPSLPR